jgi:hypothetical protein
MKKYLTITTIFLLLISYSACKSKSANTGENKTDSSKINVPDSFDQLKQTDLNQIGSLSLGMSALAVEKELGKPTSKTKAEEWGADGLLHQDWEYPVKGISLNMSSENDSTAMEVFSISITEPCTFKTKKNIGIGNSYTEVMAAYENEIDTGSSDENVVVIGSLYGGIIFEFTNKKITKIFLGAAAE